MELVFLEANHEALHWSSLLKRLIFGLGKHHVISKVKHIWIRRDEESRVQQSRAEFLVGIKTQKSK